jgi:hypothetical protein
MGMTDEWKEIKGKKKKKKKKHKSSLCTDLITGDAMGKSPLGDSIPERLPSNITSHTRLS